MLKTLVWLQIQFQTDPDKNITGRVGNVASILSITSSIRQQGFTNTGLMVTTRCRERARRKARSLALRISCHLNLTPNGSPVFFFFLSKADS